MESLNYCKQKVAPGLRWITNFFRFIYATQKHWRLVFRTKYFVEIRVTFILWCLHMYNNAEYLSHFETYQRSNVWRRTFTLTGTCFARTVSHPCNDDGYDSTIFVLPENLNRVSSQMLNAVLNCVYLWSTKLTNNISSQQDWTIKIVVGRF